MQDVFTNRLGMFHTVKTTLDLPEHTAVWQGNQPLAFGIKYTDFNTELTGLESFVVQHGQTITGAAVDKEREEQELETAAHEFGAALVCWFLRQNDATSASQVDRSISGWQRLRDEALLQQSQIVIDLAQGVIDGPDAAAAVDYGVTQPAVDALTAERADYAAVIASPQQKIASRKSLTAQYRPRFNAVQAHLDEMDNLILQYRKTDAGAALVAAYQASRIIRDLGHGPGTGGNGGNGGATLPEALIIESLAQNGSNVDVTYHPDGGVGATTLTLLWQVVGTDPDFDNSAPATPPSQSTGPFNPAETVRYKTRAENETGGTESAVQEITLI